jgi:NADH-quinone oxidoreductase subunit K
VSGIPMEYGLLLAGALFLIGLAGVLVRRNLIIVLASIEIMLNAAGVAFIIGSARWASAGGQVMFVFILAMAAAEVAVGLVLAIRFRRIFGSLDIDAADRMKG